MKTTLLTTALLSLTLFCGTSQAQFRTKGSGNSFAKIGQQLKDAGRQTVQKQQTTKSKLKGWANFNPGSLPLHKKPSKTSTKPRHPSQPGPIDFNPGPLPSPRPNPIDFNPAPLPSPRPRPNPNPIDLKPGPLPSPKPNPIDFNPGPLPSPNEPPSRRPCHTSGCTTRPAPVYSPPRPRPQPIVEPPPQPLPQVATGETVALGGNLGTTPGAVVVKIDSLLLNATVLNWQSTTVEARLPVIPLTAPTEAILAVLRADGQIAETLRVQLIPAPEVPNEPAEEITEPPAELPFVQAGSTLTLEGDDLGQEPGTVQVRIGGLTFDATVIAWDLQETTVELPALPLESATPADVLIRLADGQVAGELAIQLAPAEQSALASLEEWLEN